VFIVIVVVVVIALVVAEVLVRQRADAALADANRSLPKGASATLDSSPVLWQLATGGFELSITADDAALTTIVEQQTGVPNLTITSSAGALKLSTPVSALGVSVPFTATLDATASNGQLVLSPSTFTIGGLSVDAAQARTTLQAVGGGAGALLDGIRVPTDGSFSVTGVQVGSRSATVGVRVPLSTALNGRISP
jgi:hypothetical protein